MTWSVVILATVVRIWLVLGFEPAPASAYAFLCSEQPAAAYFTGPCGTAAVTAAFRQLGGPWWLLSGPFWALFASIALWRLSRRLVDNKIAGWSVVILNFIPAFNESALQVDALLPTLTFCLLGFGFLRDALRAQHGSWGSWVGVATSFAAASLFGYIALAYACTTLLLPYVRKAWRTVPNLLGGLLTVMASALALVPAVLWNQANAWLPFSQWTLRGLTQFEISSIVHGFLLQGQALSPLVLILFLWVIWYTWRRVAKDAFANFLAVAALPGILLTLLGLYRGWGVESGTLTAVALLLPAGIQAVSQRMPQLVWAIVLVALSFTLVPALSVLRSEGLANLAAKQIVSLDEKLSTQVPKGLFFIAGSPSLAAELNYFLHDRVIAPEGHPRIYLRENPDMRSQFSLWPSYEDFVETDYVPDEFFTEQIAENPYKGFSAIYVGREAEEDLPQSIHGAFAEVELIGELKSASGSLYLYLCLDYRTLPL